MRDVVASFFLLFEPGRSLLLYIFVCQFDRWFHQDPFAYKFIYLAPS